MIPGIEPSPKWARIDTLPYSWLGRAIWGYLGLWIPSKMTMLAVLMTIAGKFSVADSWPLNIEYMSAKCSQNLFRQIIPRYPIVFNTCLVQFNTNMGQWDSTGFPTKGFHNFDMWKGFQWGWETHIWVQIRFKVGVGHFDIPHFKIFKV